MPFTWEEVEEIIRPVPNLCHLDQARLLFETAQGLPDGAQMLEVGSWKGYTTSALAFGCVGTTKRVWTIDTFIGSEDATDIQSGGLYYQEFWKNILSLNLTEYVIPLIGKSEYFYDKWNVPLDLLFIDGDHALMVKDYNAFIPHLNENGWLFMHDVYVRGKEPFSHRMQFIYNLGYKQKGAE